MRYMVRKSIVEVIGEIWWPTGVYVAQEFTLTDHDVSNALDDNGEVTRDSMQRWLDTHAGDFSKIVDFKASIEHEDETVDIPWKDEDSEYVFIDCMFPSDDDDDDDS